VAAFCVSNVLALRRAAGLDYLPDAGVKPDGRLREAIEEVMERRHQNGRWP
jgi:hypothetical protein